MRSYKISELLEDSFSGDWGEDSNDGEGTQVIRATNFIEFGRLSFSNVVTRKVKHSVAQRKMLVYGDIIIEKSGGSPTQPVGRVAFFNVPELPFEVPIKTQEEVFICNNFCSVLRPNSKVDKEYLFHLLRNLYSQGKTRKFQNKTIGLINLKLQDYLEQEISIHENLSEQRIIVELINKSEQLIYQRRKSLSLIDDLIRSVFVKLFGQPTLFHTQFPIEKLVKASTKITDGEHGTVERVEDGYKYVMARNITVKNTLDLSDLSFISEKAHQKIYKRCNPEFDDLLLVCVGATIGKCALVPKMEEFSIARSVALIKPNRKKINPKFLLHLFNTDFIQRQIKSSSNAAAQAGLYTGKLREINIAVPPIKLQNSFAKVVEYAENLRSELNVSLKEIESLYYSLTHRAFKNELPIENLIIEHIIPKSVGSKSSNENLEIVPKGKNKKVSKRKKKKFKVSILDKGEIVIDLTTKEKGSFLKLMVSHYFKLEPFKFEELADYIQENMEEDEVGYNYDKMKKQIFDALRGRGDFKLKQLFNEKDKTILLQRVK